MSPNTPDYAEAFLRSGKTLDEFLEDTLVSGSLVAASAPQTINKAPTPPALAKKLGGAPKAQKKPKVVTIRPQEDDLDELFPAKSQILESASADDIDWSFASIPNMSPVPTLTMHSPQKEAAVSKAAAVGFGYLDEDVDMTPTRSTGSAGGVNGFRSTLDKLAMQAQMEQEVSADGVVRSWDNLPLK